MMNKGLSIVYLALINEPKAHDNLYLLLKVCPLPSLSRD